MTKPWLVLNQSYPPAFAELISQLSQAHGPCTFLGGSNMPQPPLPGITWRGATPYQRASLRTRLQSWTAFTAQAGAVALRRRPRFIFACTNPPMLPQLAWALRKARGVPYGLLIWDLYPDHLVHNRLIPEGHPLQRAWTAANRAALSDAAFVVTLGERMAETLRRQLWPKQRTLHVIPNWTQPDTIRPIPKHDNPFAHEHQQREKLTVLYSGNMGQSHGLDALAQAAVRLRSHPQLHFLFIGDGLGKPAVQAALGNTPNATMLPFEPWERVPLSLACGDIAVVTQAPGTEHLSVPSKSYSHLAAGSALLALTSPDSDLAQLVQTHQLGEVCPQHELDSIVNALLALSQSPERLSALRANARRCAETLFGPEQAFDAFSTLFSQVLPKPRN
jgi:glycosyltransferase involved in cell wall biosynthesis